MRGKKEQEKLSQAKLGKGKGRREKGGGRREKSTHLS
jgi:hypothetical protein